MHGMGLLFLYLAESMGQIETEPLDITKLQLPTKVAL